MFGENARSGGSSRTLAVSLAAVVGFLITAKAAQAVPLVGGEGPQPVTGAFNLAGDTLIPADNETSMFSGVELGGVIFDFSIYTQVYNDSSTGGLDFVYQVANTGPTNGDADIFERFTVSSFSGYSVDADYQAGTGSVGADPTTVDRVPLDGSVVGYVFMGVSGGQITDLLIVKTNATEVIPGSASVIDGKAVNGSTEVPFGATTSVPEPASLGLMGLGLSLLARRRRVR